MNKLIITEQQLKKIVNVLVTEQQTSDNQMLNAWLDFAMHKSNKPHDNTAFISKGGFIVIVPTKTPSLFKFEIQTQSKRMAGSFQFTPTPQNHVQQLDTFKRGKTVVQRTEITADENSNAATFMANLPIAAAAGKYEPNEVMNMIVNNDRLKNTLRSVLSNVKEAPVLTRLVNVNYQQVYQQYLQALTQ